MKNWNYKKLVIKSLGFILFFNVWLPGTAQQKAEQAYQIINEGYELIDAVHSNPNGFLRQRTVGKTDQDGEFITYEHLNEFNRHSSKIFDNKPYVDFDSLLTKKQKKELVKKMEKLSVVQLDPSRVIQHVLSDEEIDAQLQKIEMGKSFGYTIISFPIIQEGKNGIKYAIIYETAALYPYGDPGGNMYVYCKM